MSLHSLYSVGHVFTSLCRPAPSTPWTRPTHQCLVPEHSFIIGPPNRAYKPQCAHIYFLWLRKPRQPIGRNSKQSWQGVNSL
ncbi:hypothetical protein JB92DRAFT_2952549 [Gautieria morchelliformis]|nr:hypothetical protein JB92DRAFT_2952549 [Gautieria morchelliformis]